MIKHDNETKRDRRVPIIDAKNKDEEDEKNNDDRKRRRKNLCKRFQQNLFSVRRTNLSIWEHDACNHTYKSLKERKRWFHRTNKLKRRNSKRNCSKRKEKGIFFGKFKENWPLTIASCWNIKKKKIWKRRKVEFRLFFILTLRKTCRKCRWSMKMF